MSNELKNPNTILYVDDELQALKWFRKTFESDYAIVTASSVDEALMLTERDALDLTVLITDQRMPEKTGVDLLAVMRQKHPRVIRILTTAYSDTSSAIDAINTGAIYRYVVKPWDLRELRSIIRQAVDLYTLQRERDLLIREKLSVLQRIIIADRVQSLAVFATGLAHHIRNSMTALMYFLDLTPTRIRDEVSEDALKHPEFWGDIWSMALQQSQRILKIVRLVADNVVQPSEDFTAAHAIADLVRQGAAQGEIKELVVDCPVQIKPLRASQEMIVKLFSILLRRVHGDEPAAGGIRVSVSELPDVWGTPGVKMHFSGSGPGWDADKLVGLFTPFCQIDDNPQDLGLDLLSAFFIAHHHGGDLMVQRAPEPRGFTVHLPYDPRLARRPSLETNCLEKVFTRFSSQEVI